MFEVGENYEITYGYGATEGSSAFRVVSWEHPLLKVVGGEGEVIFNTAASHFLKAILLGDEGEAPIS